jgi:hypothetical protein
MDEADDELAATWDEAAAERVARAAALVIVMAPQSIRDFPDRVIPVV